MNLGILAVVLVGGISVIATYIIVFARLAPGNYITHPYWVGIPTSIVGVLCVFQAFAVLGFLVSITEWLLRPPTSGIMGKKYILLITLALFFLGACVWPIAMHAKISGLTVLSLVLTALASILLLAGSIDEQVARWWVVLGWILLSTVTVLGDGVIWNTKYITTTIK